MQLFTLSLFARQPKEQNPNFLKKRNYYNYRFIDKWVVNVGLGGQAYFGENDVDAGSLNRNRPAYMLSLRKQFGEYFAVRGKFTGGQHRNGLASNSLNADFSSTGFSGDLMLNVTRLGSEYILEKDPKFWVFGGAGMEKSTFASSPTFNLGLYAEFPINEKFNITAEIRGTIVEEGFDGFKGGKLAYEGYSTVLFGITYYFKRNND